MQRLKSALIVFCLWSSAALAQHGGGAPPAQGVPAEAAQYDFLIGHWALEVQPKVSGLAALVHGAPRLVGSWKAWRAFDGHGLMDELRISDASGNPQSLNQSLRVFDPRTRQWQQQTLDVYRARFGASSAQWQGGEMRGQGQPTDAKAPLTRSRFFAIGPDRFSWQQDRSSDGGASWDEGVLVIQAKRLAKQAPR